MDLKPYLLGIFQIEENDAINMHFELSGYETSDFILNTGPAFVLILLAPIYILLMLMISKTCCYKRAVTYAEIKLKGIFWNGVLSFVEAELLLLTTSANINIFQVSSSITQANISLYFAWTIQALVIISMSTLIVYMIKNNKRLKDDDVR